MSNRQLEQQHILVREQLVRSENKLKETTAKLDETRETALTLANLLSKVTQNPKKISVEAVTTLATHVEDHVAPSTRVQNTPDRQRKHHRSHWQNDQARNRCHKLRCGNSEYRSSRVSNHSSQKNRNGRWRDGRGRRDRRNRHRYTLKYQKKGMDGQPPAVEKCVFPFDARATSPKNTARSDVYMSW